jgi:1A family penicillin-binding protein
MKTKTKIKKLYKKLFILAIICVLLVLGATAMWVSTFKLPDLSSFEDRKVSQSTKIYDRTGKILLYNIHQDIKRTVVPFETISKNIKNAAVAIEDADFYEHHGIKITSLIRATLANFSSGSYGQGGSTITQQVVKNSLLTQDKTISRKLKEIYLSLKIERTISKEEILSLYLNETPYGGNLYGVEEASKAFFGKSSDDLSIAESAYLAAIPQAPTFFSPYGNNKQALDNRKNLVLQKMLEKNFITKDEYDAAKKEVIEFKPKEKYGISAPHFVEFVRQYLIEKYGERAVEENGYKVITTLDYNLQQKAEEIVKRKALENSKAYNAENASLVAIDPKTGQILVMVGSRDYFDAEIDGNFNIAIAERQPGSTFKPFVYATAFEKGYTPDTVLFDLPTEFNSSCSPIGPITLPGNNRSSTCYAPVNYTGTYVGPISLRSALAQSRNVPSVKLLYLAGIKDSLQTAKSMGITTLSNADTYGLTLVLGGGEVSLLDMTSAYGVFANSGARNPYASILSIEDSSGKVIEKFEQKENSVLPEDIALTISDVLSDDAARAPVFGAHSSLYFSDRQVAVKTGTTNDYKDAWIVGYTPDLVVGAWVGNNDNTPMDKKVAGYIVSPLWNEFIKQTFSVYPSNPFKKPSEISKDLKPVLRGFWQGNETYIVDKISGLLATEYTPSETREEKSVVNPHSILYWVDKNNPTGPVPTNPENDSQFASWEFSVQEWLRTQNIPANIKPSGTDSVHTSATRPNIIITSPANGVSYDKDQKITVSAQILNTSFPLKADFYLNDNFIGSAYNAPYSISFIPSQTDNLKQENIIRVVGFDGLFNKNESSINFKVN